ncbi:MAG: response regulator [Chloroherpetonaceae bacterium]|nr:response regulator [Chloroherpetonaceae bacterium]MDW8438151.1 response regulator [Chloroherpetonaceae bacterium]
MPHKVLFVDDEPNIVQSLSLLFDDYDVLTATSGEEALKYFRNGNVPDVIVSDQRMPMMTGVELLQKVKELSPNTVRILLTGYSDLDAIIDSVNAGEIFRYINKPWNSAKLKDTVALACQFSDRLKNAPPPSPASKIASAPPSAGVLSALGVPTSATGASEHHLLFVDPNPANLQAYKDLLASSYAVHTALNAQDAFAILKIRPIDVLITEVNLGATSAVDFLAAVSASYPDVVSILLSDSRDASIAIRLINEVQIFRYLIKPFQRQLLKSAIELAISRHDEIAGRADVNPKRYMGVVDAIRDKPAASLDEALARVRELLAARKTY